MPRSARLRVLLAGAYAALHRALLAAGHDVTSAPDSFAALAAAEERHLDVVVIDRDSFQGEPFALAKAVRATSLGFKPFFALLAPPGHDDRLEDHCREAGIDLLLFAPVAPSLVAGFLDRLGSVVAEYDSFDPAI